LIFRVALDVQRASARNGESEDGLRGRVMLLFLRTHKYGAITRHFISKKQGCRYNGVSMNGESPNKAMEALTFT
jgi:hypothetical protein